MPQRTYIKTKRQSTLRQKVANRRFGTKKMRKRAARKKRMKGGALPSYVIPGVVIASLATGAYAAYHAINNKYSAETADFLAKRSETEQKEQLYTSSTDSTTKHRHKDRPSVTEYSHRKKSTPDLHFTKESDLINFKLFFQTLGLSSQPEEEEVDLKLTDKNELHASSHAISLIRDRRYGKECILPRKLSAHFYCYDNPGGGDCLFHVLLLILHIENTDRRFADMTVNALRTEIVDVLRNNPNGNQNIATIQDSVLANYNHLYKRKHEPDINLQDYCNYMGQPTIWGTAAEISVFVYHFKVPVRVWRNDTRRNRIHEIAEFRDMIPVADDRFPHCIYNTGNHYQYIAPKTRFNETITRDS